MPRKARANQVPVAPFNLREIGPLSTGEAYAKVGYRWFWASPGASELPGATIDPAPCPNCGQEVEWALTTKRTAEGKPEKYVYARCKLNPKTHRWGFRDAPETTIATQPESTPTPIPLTNAVGTTEPAHMNAPATTQPATSFDALIDAVIDAKIGTRLEDLEAKATIDPEAVRDIVRKALDGKPDHRPVSIEIPSLPKASFKGKAHPALERILTLIAAGETFFMICGPAASGKSTLGKQVAETLKKKLTAVSINETMAREEILGWRSPNISTGEQHYTPSAVVEGWERGDVILLDEVDRGNPNTLCALNSIEQHVLYVPRSDAEGGSEARMGQGAVVICTANTYGTGASRTYVGANQLDAAFLDRFRLIEVSYDRTIEVEVCGADEIAERAVSMMEHARKRADERQVRRPLATRMVRRAVLDARIASKTDDQGLREAFRALAKNAGWTATESDGVWLS